MVDERTVEIAQYIRDYIKNDVVLLRNFVKYVSINLIPCSEQKFETATGNAIAYFPAEEESKIQQFFTWYDMGQDFV